MTLPLKNDSDGFPGHWLRRVQNCLQEMLELGTIWPSQTAWCNGVVFVRKKDGGLWFCIDFHHLNAHTKKDSYPCPEYRRHWKFGRCWAFFLLGPQSRFWQIKMEEASMQYTAFTVDNLGFFKCDCMPFGLCHVLATFQRLMQHCLGELNLIYCLIYLDDLIMFLWTTEEHLHRLLIVFHRLREYNLKLKLSKCSLFKEEINYLAHQVSKQGVWPSDANLRAIVECAPPWTYMEIHTFLGLIGHYRWFIKGFVWIAQPPNEHLAREGASRKLEWVLLSEDALEAFQA